MSFVTNLNALKLRLENNEALQAYASLNFNQLFTVKRIYKNRVEIDMGELPLIFITRPSVTRTTENQIISKLHSVNLYIGFYQEDYEKAQDNVIELDELLDPAIITKISAAGDVPMKISLNNSDNDEGVYHPAYFIVKQITIKERSNV